jgi:hypothetical protein
MDCDTQKQADLIYGLMKEKPTARLIEKVFNMKLTHSRFNYSLFDYYDDTETYIFEVKNYRYSYNQYNTVIIGCNKGISENSILIFRHNDDNNECYFIQFNKELFKTFNVREIWYRNASVYCYDIPKKHITKIEQNKSYTLINNEGERENIKNIIKIDRDNYLKTKQ